MRAILFDFGGTLDSNGIAWKDRFFSVYRDCGVSAPQAAFDRAFYDSDDNLPARHALKGLGLEKTLELQVADVFANLKLDDKESERRVRDMFLEDSRRSFAANRPVLEELSREFRLGIVSNFYGNLESVLESESLLKYFGAVADSGVVGVIKPDAALFMHALDRLEVRPEDAVMVGDSVHRDMAGAKNAGIYQALLWGARTGKSAPPDLGPRSVVLENLAELPGKIPAGRP